MSPKEIMGNSEKKFDRTIHGKTEVQLKKIKGTLEDRLQELKEDVAEVKKEMGKINRELNLRAIENDLE